jgi:uncharacterized membrane protein
MVTPEDVESDAPDAATVVPDKPRLDEIRETGRLEAFSDGVFAVAITLLVLEIKLPQVGRVSLWHELEHQWPQFFGYVLSFITIGIYWSNHHNMFKYIQRANQTLLLLNLFFLMCIVFLPFTTGELAAYIGHPGWDQKLATILYNGSFLVCGMFYNLVWRYGVGASGLSDPGVDAATYAKMTTSYTNSLYFYFGAMLLPLVNVPLALAVPVMLSAYYAMPPRLRFKIGHRPRRLSGTGG